MRYLAAIALVLLLTAGCTATPPVRQVRLSKVVPTSAISAYADPDTKPIRVAAASILSPQETIRSYGMFFDYLERKIGRPVDVIQRKTYEETYDLLRYGSLDVALVCTYVYVRGREEIGLELLVAPEVNGRSQYRSLIITRADSRIHTFDDLAGKRFAFTDPLSTSGRIYPLALLKARQQDPGTFFSSTTYTYSHDNSIKAVAEGIVDAAAVDSLVYDQWVSRNSDRGVEFRIIAESEWLPSPPVVVSKRVDPHLREALREALLTMDQDPEGKEILSSLGIDRFVLQSDEEYQPVRALAQQAGMAP